MEIGMSNVADAARDPEGRRMKKDLQPRQGLHLPVQLFGLAWWILGAWLVKSVLELVLLKKVGGFFGVAVTGSAECADDLTAIRRPDLTHDSNRPSDLTADVQDRTTATANFSFRRVPDRGDVHHDAIGNTPRCHSAD
jgi:hypothetical protein